MLEISNKLSQLHQAIRKEQIASLMKKRRYEEQCHSNEELLRPLLHLDYEDFTSAHLQLLVELANKDVTNAILHLGNLVIDRFLCLESLEGIEWRIGSNEKWTWLINAFSEIGFCTGDMFQHCLRRIISKRSNFNLENALEVLQKSFKFNEQAIDYVRQPELILALSNHVHEPTDRIGMVALSIFTTITSQDEAMPEYICQVVGEPRVTQMLLHCLVKVNSTYRALACQIANNFLMSGVGLEDVRLRILELALSEKEKVKLEISFYLKGFAENAPQDVILGYIKRHRLLEILQKYSKICSVNPKFDRQISQNAMKSLGVIFHRFNASTHIESILEGERERLMEKVEKMMQDSEVQTLYEEESRLMIQ